MLKLSKYYQRKHGLLGETEQLESREWAGGRTAASASVPEGLKLSKYYQRKHGLLGETEDLESRAWAEGPAVRIDKRPEPMTVESLMDQMTVNSPLFRQQNLELRLAENQRLSTLQREDPTAYQREMAAKHATEQQNRLQEAEQQANQAMERQQALIQEKAELDSQYANLGQLYEKYRQTGSSVDANAYLIAAKAYEESAAAYNSRVQEAQKDNQIFESYEKAYLDAENARTAYNDANEKYLQAHSQEKYQEEMARLVQQINTYSANHMEAERAEAQKRLDYLRSQTRVYQQIQREMATAQQLQTQQKYEAVRSEPGFAKFLATDPKTWSREELDAQISKTEQEISALITAGQMEEADAKKWELARLYQLQSLGQYGKVEELATYEYLKDQDEKSGGREAQDYLDWIQETLNYRKGMEQAGNIRDIDNGALRALAMGAHSIGSGMANAGAGFNQLLSDKPVPTPAMQYASEELMKDMGTVGKYLYRAGSTVGNMLPTIVLSTMLGIAGAPAAVAGAAGSAAMGASAAGNTYTQAVKEGYDPEGAKTYAALVGASEAVLQYLLGGIGKLGGVTDDLILTKVSAIDNALARMALTGAVKVGSEIAEEELQLFLEPAFKSILFDEEYSAPKIEEIMETAIVTALSTGLLESPEIIGSVQNSNVVPVMEAVAEDQGSDVRKIRTVAEMQNYLKNMEAAKETQGIETVQKTQGMEAENEAQSTDDTGRTDTVDETAVGEAVRNEQIDVPVQVAAEEGIRWAGNEPEAEAVNGGNDFENRQQNEIAGADGEAPTAREGLFDGNERRNAGESAGGQAGILAEDPEGARKRADEQFRTATGRQNRARSIPAQRISSAELGIEQGTDAQTLTIAPEEAWDAGMRETAERVWHETGKRVTYVLGRIQTSTENGGTAYVRGVYSQDGIILQADHFKLTIDQIADHEIFHARKEQSPELLKEIEDKIVEKYGEETFREIVNTYIQKLRGIIDIPENASEAELNKAFQNILEEIFADAYAGINAFSAHAEQFHEDVKTIVESNSIGRAGQSEADADRATGPPQKFSIAEIEGENGSYGIGVILDTKLFDNVRPKDWGNVLGKYVYKNMAGSELTVYDGAGNPETVYLARETDRVRKNGAKHPHKVLDKLAGYRGNSVRAKAIVQLDEVLATSRYENTTSEHSHQWMDENGWIIRKAYLQDLDGNIYEATLNIADGRDRKILYEVNRVHRIDKKMTAASIPSTDDRQRSRYQEPGMGRAQSEVIKHSVAETKKDVNGEKNKTAQKFSVEEDGEEPQGIQWAGNTPDLEASQEQNPAQTAEQSAAEAEQQSQEEPPTNKKRRKKPKPVAQSLPIIAKNDLKKNLYSLFSVPKGQQTYVEKTIDQFADRLLKKGKLTDQDRESFFIRMFGSGLVTMKADQYSRIGREAVTGGRIYVNEKTRQGFGNEWNQFRKRAFASGVYLTDNQSDAGINTWYTELEEMLPGLFNSEELHARGILEGIIQMAEEGKDERVSLAEYTQQLAHTEHISEDELLENMSRQMDWMLRTFAEKAKLEIRLRDRTGVKIQQERERFAESRNAQMLREETRRAKERDERREALQRQRERKELQELQRKTLKQLQWLSKNRNKAPEQLKQKWDDVLGDIDIFAAGAANEMRWNKKYNATWQDLAQMYKDAQENDPNFLPSKELEMIVARLDGKKIADMDIGALQDLYKAAVGLRTEFYNRNNVINDENGRLFAEVYADAKEEIEKAPGGYKGKGFDKLMNLDQLTPMNVLERMGGWNPDGAFYSMAKQLEKGERDIRDYTVKANEMLAPFLTKHQDWVKKADGQGKDAIWYEIEVPELVELHMGDKPIFGDTIKVYMTPAQKVHLYLESKNTDNLRHMTGGRTFVNKELYSQGKRAEALAQGTTIRMAPETVKKIVSNLTAEEMELAKVLQRYYNEFATEKINAVSNTLYGYDKAMGKNYAPIYSNRNYTKSEIGIFDTTAEGVGNLKARQYAVNPSYNISAFDAFERHVDQTARFTGMSIPARNWTTLLNWRERNNSTGDVITHKWGEEGKRYITDLIGTLQSGASAERDSISSAADTMMSNYISAVFGSNPSIVFKQLGSIPLASVYLDIKNFPKPSQIKGIDRNLIGKYTSELAWRTMGYSTPETKQLKDNPNWTQTNKFTKFTFGGGAITAMDGWAASVLWPWAENNVRSNYPDLAVGTQEQINAGESPFYKKVAEVFNNAVARSQSTSDEIHQSTIRKSKNPVTRAFTMFRSDSAQVYNALRQKMGEAKYYIRTGADAKTIRKAKRSVGAVFLSAIGGYVWAQTIEFLMNLWKHQGKKYRDDEDELNAESVAKEMALGIVEDLAGIVVGGGELAEIIGNILTGDRWYGIDAPGMEQLENMIELAIDTMNGGMETIKGAADIVKNGGNLTEYFHRHGNDILGGIKDAAKAVATYFPGIPVNNLEAYILGMVKWISPELGTAYDDLWETADKNGLKVLTGSALTERVGSILENRLHDSNEQTASALAALYEAGYPEAIPTDTPKSVTVDGESHELSEYQKQFYDMVWQSSIGDSLDELIGSETFQNADTAHQAKMTAKLYSYAAEKAKSALFEDYEIDGWAKKVDTLIGAGMTMSEIINAYIHYNDLYQDENLKASEKATEFAWWVDNQDYTNEQAASLKEQFAFFSMVPAQASKYEKLTDAGLDEAAAHELTEALNALEPEAGKRTVSDLQRFETIISSGLDTDHQEKAIRSYLSENQLETFNTLMGKGMTSEQYVQYRRATDGITSDKDANGETIQGSKKEKILAAIDALPISDELKTELYYAEGYTESTLDDAPWYEEPEGIMWAGR